MIIKKVHPDMPTSTVALDLLSRAGLPEKYSLSPFPGYAGERFKVAGYQDFRADQSFEKFIRMKDNFTFNLKDVFYSIDAMQQDIDYEEEEYDEEEYDEGIVATDNDDAYELSDNYVPGSETAPTYVRRFEDFHDLSKITKYLRTVVRNAIEDADGYDKNRDRVSFNVQGDSDDEEVNVNELATEEIEDTDESRMRRYSRESLIRSMYRLNLLSRELGVSVISVLLSYCRYYKTLSSKVAGKPLFLVQNGPVYMANTVNGNCGLPLENPNDRALTRVRDVIWPTAYQTNKYVDEFYSDCWTFVQCIKNLNINAHQCDATRYTWDWINYYSRKILINNYAYVCRKIGGYNIDILNSLRNISLDMAVNESTEEVVDTYTTMLNLIESATELESGEFPAEVYHALQQSTSSSVVDTCVNIVKTLQNYEEYDDSGIKSVTEVSDGFSVATSEEGYILDNEGKSLYKLRIANILPDNMSRYLTGCAFVHCTGWIVMEPLSDITVIMKLETVMTWLLRDVKLYDCPRLVIGPGRAKL